MGRRLTDAEIAALPEEKRRETLKKRKQRAKNLPPAPPRVSYLPGVLPSGEGVPGIDTADIIAAVNSEENARLRGALQADMIRQREIYDALQARLIQNGRWSGEATHGLLLTYVKASVCIEHAGIAAVPPSVLSAQASSANKLRLLELPPEKVRPGAGKFGKWA